MGDVTKTSELKLSKETEKLYVECLKIARDTLPKLGIDPAFFKEYEDYRKLSKLIEVHGIQPPGELTETSRKLNHIFAEKNNLPETVIDDNRVKDFLSEQVKKGTGKEIPVSVTKKPMGVIISVGDEFWIFGKGMPIAFAFIGIEHEKAHITNPFVGDYDTRRNIQTRMRSSEPGSKNIRRAIDRYDDGRAMHAMLGFLKSNDDVVKAYSALEILKHLAYPTPQLYSEQDAKRPEAERDAIKYGESSPQSHMRKYGEGLRHYYTLHERIGRENFEKIERACVERGFALGIDSEGKLVVIESKVRMYDVDGGKLEAGETSIEKLVKELAPKIPGIFR